MKPLRYLALAGLISALVIIGIRHERLGRRLAELESRPPASLKKAERVRSPQLDSSRREQTAEDLSSSAELVDQLAKTRQELADARKEVDRLREENQRRAEGVSALRAPLPSMGTEKQAIEHWAGGQKRSWGHEQAAGAPDTGQAGDIPSAWASKDPDGGEEWLKLDYDHAVDIEKISVFESHNPGAITKVAAVLPNGREEVIWEGDMEASTENELVSSDFLANAGIKARSVKVYLDTAKVPGWNEIDAVQLRGRDGSTQWASASSASTSYADP